MIHSVAAAFTLLIGRTRAQSTKMHNADLKYLRIAKEEVNQKNPAISSILEFRLCFGYW
jgi:hypothetical protein